MQTRLSVIASPTLHDPLRRVLVCLDIENRSLATFFEPPQGSPLLPALQDHLEALHALAVDPAFRRIVAAGLLALGNLERLDEILDAAPPDRARLDHGAGWCAHVASSTIAALLPLPPDSPSPSTWLAGSSELAFIRNWMMENRSRLVWDSVQQRYSLA